MHNIHSTGDKLSWSSPRNNSILNMMLQYRCIPPCINTYPCT
jgi:hypothetical protein